MIAHNSAAREVGVTSAAAAPHLGYLSIAPFNNCNGLIAAATDRGQLGIAKGLAGSHR